MIIVLSFSIASSFISYYDSFSDHNCEGRLKMKLENTGIDELTVDVKSLNHLMGLHGFILGESWDYERVTYDYKIASNEKNVTYYIRIQGYAVEGDVDRGDAMIKIMTPLLGKHYFPHGVEYGEDENFPKNLVKRAHNLVIQAREDIESHAN